MIISNYRFSKIGTNPMKYLNNFKYYLNNIPIGEEIKINGLNILHQDIVQISFNSNTTHRQNLDAWLWMGFIVQKDENTYIKIIKSMNEEELLEHSKYNLLVNNKNKKINDHRKTIIIKLLTASNKKSVHNDYSFEEIYKEFGKYEEILLEDEKFIKILKILWGKNE